MRIVLVIALLVASAATATGDEAASEARRLMRLGGVGPAQWARFQDGRRWSEPEQETLQKILFRLTGMPAGQMESLVGPPVDWRLLREDPAAFRGRVVRLVGRVRSVEVVPLDEAMAKRFETAQCYRVTMQPDAARQPVAIYTRTIPKAWRTAGPIDEPGGAWAMFVKLAKGDSDVPMPVFAAKRVAWYDENRLLGRLGMDVGLLDDLTDRRPLGARERECFYQALAAAGRAKPPQLAEAAGEDHPVEPLFNSPATERGKPVALSGTARRVLRVRVDDPDIRRRFGIDHYYEIYLSTRDSQGNPVVFCVAELPEGMPTGNGAGFAEPVSVAGFFLKSWAFASGRPAEDDRPAPLQLAPLLVGHEAVWRQAERQQGDASIGGAVAGAAFVLVLLIVWLWLLKMSRADRRTSRVSRADGTIGPGVNLEPPAGESNRMLDSNATGIRDSES